MTKPKIGCHYAPKRQEVRDDNRTYAAFNVPLDRDELWVQSVLLANTRTPRHWLTVLSTAAVSVVAFLFFIFN